MAELFEEHQSLASDTDFIVSEDLVAQKLLKEIYFNLKHKPSNELSIEEHCWLSSIEGLYRDKKSTISNRVDWFLKMGHGLLKEERELNNGEREMLISLRRVLDFSSKNNSMAAFFAELENSVEALFRLDYSKKPSIPAILKSDENDLLNYIVMTVDMIRERLGQSVVSGKVVKSLMERISNIGVLVTDEQGRIRFANDKMGELLGTPCDELIGGSIKKIVGENNTLINASADVKADAIKIQQIKVPSVNGQIDEWIYTFSKQVDLGLNVYQLREIQTIMDEFGDFKDSDLEETKKLLKVLKSKLSMVNGVSTPSTDILNSGSNIQSLINDSLSKLNSEMEEIEVKVDAKAGVYYFGDDEKLKMIVDQMFSCSCKNLSESMRESKLEIVVSSFQHHLLLAFMDNGAIVSNFSMINELRENVKKIKGTLDLNSGRMGNNLSVIIPI